MDEIEEWCALCGADIPATDPGVVCPVLRAMFIIDAASDALGRG